MRRAGQDATGEERELEGQEVMGVLVVYGVGGEFEVRGFNSNMYTM